jgi:hypothetical protein
MMLGQTGARAILLAAVAIGHGMAASATEAKRDGFRLLLLA